MGGADKEDFPQTIAQAKFTNKEGFPRFPTSTSTNGVLQICRKAICLLQLYRKAKFLGVSDPAPPVATPLLVIPVQAAQTNTTAQEEANWHNTSGSKDPKLKVNCA